MSETVDTLIPVGLAGFIGNDILTAVTVIWVCIQIAHKVKNCNK